MRAVDGVSLTVERGEVFGVLGQGFTSVVMQLESAEQAMTELPHLVHLFSKLDVPDRTAAVTVAVERGLIRLGQ